MKGVRTSNKQLYEIIVRCEQRDGPPRPSAHHVTGRLIIIKKIKCTNIRGAHLQCQNNHCAKLEYKGMKTVVVTDYTHITQCKQSKGNVDAIMSKFNTPKKIITY